jgi:hypothetical protein
MIYSCESLQKKQNQQDYAALQELDERSVSKCVFADLIRPKIQTFVFF